jgi:CHRD domain
MRRRSVLVGVALVLGALLVASLAVAAGGKRNLKAGDLIGYEENPDISTVATGSFKATLDDAAQTVEYELRYSGLEGTVLQAHVHFGKRAVNGGISFFLCGTAAFPGPAGTPTCPQSGTVTRTVGVADILGPAGQGIEAMNYAELAAAMRSGNTYANVHSTKWPGGEIRAQINDR